MLRFLFLIYSCLGFLASVYADDKMLQLPQVQKFIQDMVRQEHFNQKELTNTIREAKLQEIIIEKMDKPYEGKPWDVYRELFLTPARIEAGHQFWKQHQNVLAQAEKKFGVPASIIVGILGVETIYGRQQGGFRVLDALSTLAFYYPKRSPYFLYELKQYLLMCREHHLSPKQFIGSYAGAMGQAQFMPSSYRRWAIKYQGNGAPDLVNNANDAIFSIANYLQRHGWKRQEKIVQQVDLREFKCKDIQMNLKHATYSYQHLIQCGFKPTQFHWSHPKRAGILELILTQGNEYHMGYPNFYVVLTYNSSPLYGMAVYLLGNAIASKV
jgi:membrane-bound lytic murein transglycosylase B